MHPQALKTRSGLKCLGLKFNALHLRSHVAKTDREKSRGNKNKMWKTLPNMRPFEESRRRFVQVELEKL